MKKKLLLAMGSAAAIAAVSIGGTLALFTDSKSASADIVAGTLCLSSERNDGDPVPGPMFYITAKQGATPSGVDGTLPTGYWAPGDAHKRTLNVRNDEACSSMNAWVSSIQARLNEHFGDQYEPLAEKLYVTVKSPKASEGFVVIAEGPLSDFLAGPVTARYPDGSSVPIYLSSVRQMEFEVAFDIQAGNQYQGKTLVVDFIVNAEQMPNNP